MATVDLRRTRDRNHLGVPLRVERLEEDADVHEAILEGVAAQLRTINARLMGVLVSLVVASIMLAANLAVK